MKEPLFKVPIRNLFYLISYAYHLSEFRDSLNTVDGELITLDFIVEQFNKRVNHLYKEAQLKITLPKWKKQTEFLVVYLLMNPW